MLEEESFTSYAFNPDPVSMHKEKEVNCKSNEAIMKYTNLDKNTRKQEKSNLKRSIRRRVEKVRNFRSSDIESDTGSDGLAVNSEGSGRSGDWGPPKIRRKSKSYRKRQETRTSLTDSGISLSKTDLESLSGLSGNTHNTPEYRRINGYHQILQNAYIHAPTPDIEEQTTDLSAEHDSSELIEYSSISTSSSQKSSDKNTDSANNNDTEKSDIDVIVNIEEKENAILAQCLKNEKLVNCDDNACSYVVDCSDAVSKRLSRFPLPDHLNYPICRYRIKTDSSRIHPLKKLKDGWKKLKSKKIFQDKTAASADVDCYPEFYPEYVTEKEDDNETILSRLSRNPNQRRNFARRVFDRLGSKSYSIHDVEKFDDRRGNCRMTRSGSTRSVPDALQDMWNKVHKEDLPLPCEQSNYKSLHKVKSMPNIQRESVLFKEDQCGNDNYFSQLDNHTEKYLTPNVRYHNSEKALTAGVDLVDSLSRMQIGQQEQNYTKPDRKVSFNENTMNYYDEFKRSRNAHDPNINNEDNKNDSLKSSKKYSSCHELYQNASAYQKANCITPQMYFPPAAPCLCCMPGQPMQYVPFYPYPNYVYQVSPYGGYPPMEFIPNYYPMNAVQPFYPQNAEHSYQLVNGNTLAQRTVDNVIAPLDVKIEHEKKAEKRKIADMTFDTFV